MNSCLLGDIQFEVLNSPTSLDFAAKHNYPQHAKIDGKPTLQLVGSDLNTLNLSLRFNWQTCDPDARLRELLAAKEKGMAMAFYFGGGQYNGNYVIESLNAKTTRTNAKGQAVAVEVQLALREWRTAIKPKIEIKEKEQQASPFKKLTSIASLDFKPGVVTAADIKSPEFSNTAFSLR